MATLQQSQRCSGVATVAIARQIGESGKHLTHLSSSSPAFFFRVRCDGTLTTPLRQFFLVWTCLNVFIFRYRRLPFFASDYATFVRWVEMDHSLKDQITIFIFLNRLCDKLFLQCTSNFEDMNFIHT